MDNISARGNYIRWESSGYVVADRPFYGAEKVLLEQRDEARAEAERIKETEFPRRIQLVADNWRKKCEQLEAENEHLHHLLKIAYCQKIGSDSTNGLDCCDDYLGWLLALKLPSNAEVSGGR